jgi:hypothetical protein
MDDYRESIWGINSRDRRWFQFLTLIGGMAGSVILTMLELDSLSNGVPASEVARNIVLSIGASFIASGFIAWGLLQAKELIMPIGDWIREANEKRRERLREEGREQMKPEVEAAREEGHQEGYVEGYEDSQEGRPPQRTDSDSTNGTDGAGGNDANRGLD